MISNSSDLRYRYCSEPIENIENYSEAVADKEHMWDCHHRNEICLANQSRLDRGITSKAQLIADGMYYNRPASELIFLRQDAHMRLHYMDRSRSEETKRKMAESNPLKKQVEMKRKSDGFTMTFPSHSEAARWLRENGYPKATSAAVSKCAHGHKKTAYNATWRNP